MGAFMMVVLKQSAEVAWETFSPYHNQIVPFRDASYGDECNYECTVAIKVLITLIGLPLFKRS